MRKLSRSAYLLSFAFAAAAFTGPTLTGPIAPAMAVTPTSPLVVEHNHKLTYGTFLGGVGDDAARGAVVLNDGSIIVAGNFTNLQTRPINNAVQSPNPLNAAANAKGKLIKLAADGRILAEVTLGNRIDDIDRSMASNQISNQTSNQTSNQIVVGGDFGVVVLNAANLSIVWSKQLPEAPGSGNPDGGQTRVAISKSNQVIALRQNTLTLFNPQGNQKARTVLKGKLAADGVTKIPDASSFVTDVAIDPNDQRVYTVGFSNRRNNASNQPVQVPFLYSLDTIALNIQSKTWDYDANTLVRPGLDKKGQPTTLNDMADSRLYQVVIGGDGKLTVAGESAGGNSVFRWGGQTLPTDDRDTKALTLIAYDAYSSTYNSKSPHMLYYAKVDIATGVVAAGQYAVPRLPPKGPGQTGLANAFRMKDGGLAVDGQGNIFIAGVSAYGIPERDLNKFNGVAVGPYSSTNMEDMVMLMVSPDLKSRLRWTPFAKGAGGGGGVMNAIVPTSNGRVVVVGTATHGELMTTANATRPNPFDPAPNKVDNARDVYLGILQIP